MPLLAYPLGVPLSPPESVRPSVNRYSAFLISAKLTGYSSLVKRYRSNRCGRVALVVRDSRRLESGDGRTELEAQRLFQAVKFDEPQVAQDVSACTVGDDPSGIEQNRPRTKVEHHFEVMRGDELGGRQTVDKLDQTAAAARVEIGGGLVEHEYGRITGQHAGETDTLSLAEAQMMGRAIGEISQVDAIKAFDAMVALPGGLSHV